MFVCLLARILTRERPKGDGNGSNIGAKDEGETGTSTTRLSRKSEVARGQYFVET